jgi:hypothetical protein
VEPSSSSGPASGEDGVGAVARAAVGLAKAGLAFPQSVASEFNNGATTPGQPAHAAVSSLFSRHPPTNQPKLAVPLPPILHGRADHASGGPVLEPPEGARLMCPGAVATPRSQSSRTAKSRCLCDAKPGIAAQVDILDFTAADSKSVVCLHVTRRMRLTAPAAAQFSPAFSGRQIQLRSLRSRRQCLRLADRIRDGPLAHRYRSLR